MVLKPRAIADDVYWVGVNDTVKKLFESIWPIPSGISYNAYVVIGSKGVALIDTVDEHYVYEYLGKVKEVVGNIDKVKYLVINHLEPDHHGATPYVLERVGNAKVVTSSIGSKIIKSIYRIPDSRVLVVNDGERIDLGGKTLKFVYTPWLHWPETMMTYIEEDGILFSCDAFGSYGALEKGLFDDELNIDFYLDEAKRYFSNIVAKYSRHVLNAIEKLRSINIKIIAPSHGPIYRTYVNKIIELYIKWSKPETNKDKVVIVYASMYSRSKGIVDIIADKLRSSKLNVVLHDVSTSHLSYMLSDILDANTLFIIYPSYDAGIFPLIENLLYTLQLKELGRGRNVAIINTFAWASTTKQMIEILQKAGFNIVEPIVETKALPDEKAIDLINKLVEKVVTISSI